MTPVFQPVVLRSGTNGLRAGSTLLYGQRVLAGRFLLRTVLRPHDARRGGRGSGRSGGGGGGRGSGGCTPQRLAKAILLELKEAGDTTPGAASSSPSGAGAGTRLGIGAGAGPGAGWPGLGPRPAPAVGPAGAGGAAGFVGLARPAPLGGGPVGAAAGRGGGGCVALEARGRHEVLACLQVRVWGGRLTSKLQALQPFRPCSHRCLLAFLCS